MDRLSQDNSEPASLAVVGENVVAFPSTTETQEDYEADRLATRSAQATSERQALASQEDRLDTAEQYLKLGHTPSIAPPLSLGVMAQLRKESVHKSRTTVNAKTNLHQGRSPGLFHSHTLQTLRHSDLPNPKSSRTSPRPKPTPIRNTITVA